MKTFMYDITNLCNLRCSHCYNSSSVSNDINNIKEYNIDNVLTYINNMQDVERVHILGGEPLMAKNLKYFIDGLNNNIKVSINTNGTLLSKYADYIIFNNKIDQITISLDGYNSVLNDNIRGKGSFDTVYRELVYFNKLKTRYKSNLDVHIAYVITHTNYRYLYKLVNLGIDLSISSIFLSFLYYEGNSKNLSNKYNFEIISENILKLLEEAEKNNINIVIDVKPIVLLYWKIIFHVDIDFNNIGTNHCYALEGMRYISNENKVYFCGPSSKLNKSKYIIDLNKSVDINENISINSVVIKNKYNSCSCCIFEKNCSPCPIGVKCTNEEFCEFAINQLHRFLDNYFIDKLNIEINLLDSRIIRFENEFYIYNFRIKKSVKLGMIDINFSSYITIGDIIDCPVSFNNKFKLMLGIYEAVKYDIIKLKIS